MGLQRTGTTFLQKNVFPAFEGVEYIDKKKYQNARKIIQRSTYNRILISREFNKSFEKHLNNFRSSIDAEVFPIIVLRRQDLWLKSQYKRHVKNGTKVSIEEFFPLNEDKGHLNTDALDFHQKLTFLEKTFTNRPLVLLHEDLLKNPQQTIECIGRFISAKVNPVKLNLNPRHTSYSDHQLGFLYWSYQHLMRGPFRKSKIYRYPMLHLAKMIPKKWLNPIDLFPSPYMNEVRKKYEKDWELCLSYQADQSK